MPFNLVPTPVLEVLLNEAPDTQQTFQAIAELNRLRAAHCHLLTHFVAVKSQTEASTAGLQSLLGEIKPHNTAHLTRGQLE